MQVVAPDGWNFEIHQKGRNLQYSSRPDVHDSKLLYVGNIEIHTFGAYLERADMLLSRAETKRSDANRGHQKTPVICVCTLLNVQHCAS